MDFQWLQFTYTLKEVTIGGGITSIGQEAFSSANALELELTIPDQVETIGADAFFNVKCISYTEVLKALPAPADYWGAKDHKIIEKQ